jgi:PiT family inorganic phosphate transporter
LHGSDAVNWGGFDGVRPVGVLGVATVLVVTPPLAFAFGFCVDRSGRRAARRLTNRARAPVRAGQWVMSEGLALSHGANDAQKAVGVVALLLVASGDLQNLTPPIWVELACGVALTLGTALGGWPIVKTLGRRITLIRPLDALASETSSAGVVFAASIIGAPVSTSQIVASSVVGIGGGRRRWRHVRWRLVGTMLLAWLVTVPTTAALAAVALIPWRVLT